MDLEIVTKAQSVHVQAFYLFTYYFVLWLSASLLWKCPILLSLCMFGNDASYYHLIFWCSWNGVFSKQLWAESPDLTVPSEIECISLILQYICCFQLFLPLLLKSAAVEVLMQAVSEDLFLYKTVNRMDTAVIVSSQFFYVLYSAECPLS